MKHDFMIAINAFNDLTKNRPGMSKILFKT